MKKALFLSGLSLGLWTTVCAQENNAAGNRTDTRTDVVYSSITVTDPSAATTVHGNGKMVSINFVETGFKDIDVSSAIDVVVKQAPEYSVKVFAEENIADLVKVEKNGLRLTVGLKLHTSLTAKSIKVYISAPELRSITSTGTGKITSEGAITGTAFMLNQSGSGNTELELNAVNLRVIGSGTGIITLRGKTPDLLLTVSGAAIAKCFDLRALQARVSMSGLAKADVSVSQSLKVNAEDMTVLKYKGNPKVEQRVVAEGSVTRIE